MTSEKPPLRDKDKTVLHHIKEGRNDIQKITESTTLENHEVNYCFQKLEKLGLIEVKKPDGMVERVVDGQKRVFEAPKRAKITVENIEEYLGESEMSDEYELLSKEELSYKVGELEREVEEIRTVITTLKKQIQESL
jgi:predicted transcriptional regulator